MEADRGSYRNGRTRYQPLVDHLAASGEREVILTLPEIEAIIGGPLTDGAHVNGAFWRGEARSYVQRWRALGWEARLDRSRRCVVFMRSEEH